MENIAYLFTPADMNTPIPNFSLYSAFLAERDEIMRHQRVESEKAGRDIGFDCALVGWITQHHRNWRRAYLEQISAESQR